MMRRSAFTYSIRRAGRARMKVAIALQRLGPYNAACLAGAGAAELLHRGSFRSAA